MRWPVLLLLLCLAACDEQPPRRSAFGYSVSAEVEPYVASWRAEFPEHIGRLTLGWAEDLDPTWQGWKEGSIAYCRGDGLIAILHSWWQDASPEARQVTVWHELGHCWGRIECHDTRIVRLLDTKRYRSASIMYPSIDMTWHNWEAHSQEYIADMHLALADPEAYCSKEETEDASSTLNLYP